jgi:hypothetical protein
MAHPMCRSISTIFSTDDVSRRVEVTRFRAQDHAFAGCYLWWEGGALAA